MTSCRAQIQTIVFHRSGFCIAKLISRWFKSLRIHTRIHLHRKKCGDRVLRQIRTMLCADFVDHREHTVRIRIAVWHDWHLLVTIREVTEHVFDSPQETLKSQRQRRQNASVNPLWVFAIIAGHSFTQSGLKWDLYAFFFLACPAHGDPLRLDAIAVFLHNPLIGIIAAKYEMMARK